jgi:hypothetical protein
MSSAHDKFPVYPDGQGSSEKLKALYEQYHSRIHKYISLKVNPIIAEDLTQQVFLKAAESIHACSLGFLRLPRTPLKMNFADDHERERTFMILQVMNLSPFLSISLSMLKFESILVPL